jgi:hypothetical protein
MRNANLALSHLRDSTGGCSLLIQILASVPICTETELSTGQPVNQLHHKWLPLMPVERLTMMRK